MSQTVEKLTDYFKPEHYKLYLHPDKEQRTFQGSVTIKGTLQAPANLVKLHAKGLRIDSAKFSIGGAEHAFSKHTHGENDTLYLVAPVQISGELQISLEFFGEISESMVGLYTCDWQDAAGQPRQIIATQFESHHAREVFPCVDEPAAKAVFELTLKSPKGEKVLSNTPQASQTEQGKYVETTFEPTPIMSPYLLAFVFGDLVASEATTSRGVKVRIWTTPLHQKHHQFALQTAVDALQELEAFFGIPFPLPKIDHVALPDFAAGAMENWGLITYREAAIVVDESNTSLEEKEWVVKIIAHELSHQWFGNLVTMEWWDDLWLNEGFASWLEVYIADKLHPDWQLWQQFLGDAFLSAQSLDSLKSSHPIRAEITNPEEIPVIFDAISYDKGAVVIRMLHDYLGESKFSQGLRQYLSDHQYDNAKSTDLWLALESASQQPVKDMMSAWTEQTGFPVIKAEATDESIVLSQSRFLLTDAEPGDAVWPVPIAAHGTSETFLLNQASQTWNVPGANQLQLNQGASGFYIVHYSEPHLDNLLADMPQLPPADRLLLLSDQFKLFKSGRIGSKTALDLLAVYREETDTVVWDEIASQLGSIRSVFSDEDTKALLWPYVLNLVEKSLARLGWRGPEQESHQDQLLRPTILGLAAFAREPAILSEIHRRFDEMKSVTDIHPDLRTVIFATRGRHGQPSDHEKLWRLYQKSSSSQVRNQIEAGLCAFSQPDLIKTNLDQIQDGHIRLQEVIYRLAYLLANRDAKELTWQWIQTNWTWLETKFGTDLMSLSALPKLVGRAFASTEHLSQYRAFFGRLDRAGLERPIAQGEEVLSWQLHWRQREEEPLKLYLEHWHPSQVSPTTTSSTEKSPDTSAAPNS